MHFSRSLLASAALLSFSTCAEARVAQPRVDTSNAHVSTEQTPGHGGIFHNWILRNIFRKRQTLDCSTPDLYYEILDANPSSRVQTFCNEMNDIPPTTIVVEYTPTITIATSANSTVVSTTTERVVTTATVVETATATPAPLVRRAANIAAIYATANDIIQSVIDSGVAASTPSSPESTGRIAAVSGLANACSCKNVDPLTTITSTFTAPATQTTVKKMMLYRVASTTTKSYTTTTTVTQGLNETVSTASSPGFSNASVSSTEFLAGSASTSASSSATAGGASSTGALTATFATTGVITTTSSPSGTSQPIVIGLPFDCPAADGTHPQFIVGDLRYEYTIFCDTAIVTSNSVTTIEGVADATACAAECSLVNSAANKQLCQAAMFEALPGSTTGSCIISGETTSTVSKFGSATIVLSGVSSKADNCASVDLTSGPTNATVDTSSLVASVASAGFSLSTPGFITRSESGGVKQTYFSSGYTDTLGFYHYSWYEIYESSTTWWEEYATAWSCTANLPRTIVNLQPAANATAVFVDVTTIMNSGVVTVISGNSTRSFTNGAGVIPPTAVLASTTSGSGIFATESGNVTVSATAGASVEVPLPTSVSSEALGSSTGVNQTSLAPSGTGVQGSAALTGSGGTATSNSTGGGGVVPPSPTSGGTLTTTSNATGESGSYGPNSTSQAVLSGATEFNVSGGSFTANSTGFASIIPPSPTSILPSTGTGVSSSSANETLAATSAGGSANLTVSSGTAFNISTGLSGVIPPTINLSSIAPASETPSFSANITISGTGVLETSGGSSIYLATGSSGVIRPASLNTSETASATLSPTPNLNGSLLASGGTGGFFTSGGTAYTSATGSSGVILPSSVNVSETASVALPPTPTFNSSLIASTGTGVYFTSSDTEAVFTTGSSGAIPPVSANSTLSASGIFATSGGTAVSIATASSGVIPLESANSTLPASTGTGVLPTSSGMTGTSIAESSDIIPPPSLNFSTTALPTVTPGPSLNASVSSGTGVFATSSGGDNFSITGGTGVIPPSLNSTAIVPPSEVPTLSGNATTTLIGTGVSLSEALNLTVSGGTATVFSTGVSGIIPPAANSTATLPPSLTPSPSLNGTTSTGPDFSNSDLPRTGGSQPSIPLNSTISATASVRTGTALPVSQNFTASIGMGESSSTPPGGYGQQPSTTSIFTNVTSTLGTEQPSITLPPISLNSSSAPYTANTTGPDFSNTGDDRIGRSRSRSSSVSGSFPVLSANTTLWPPGTSVIASAPSFVPTQSANSSHGYFSSYALGTAPLNITLPPPVRTNYTLPPSATPSPSLNGSAEACPTASEFSTIALVSVITTTYYETVPIAPSTCLSSSEPLPTVNATLPSPTGPSSIPLATYSTSTVAPLPPSATEALSHIRRANETATQEQIDAACADPGNIVVNSGFELANDNNALGWTIAPDDAFISFRTYPYTYTFPNGTAAENRTARILAAAPGRAVFISQPLTLCPGKQYNLTSFNRQDNVLAQCSLTYYIGDLEVYRSSPQEVWPSVARSGTFTAGTTKEEVSRDLRIRGSCEGQGGAPAGTDEAGLMGIEFDDVSVMMI